ncbi:uncharacterized protein DSM5745_04977 [Aspergillus mulundensis]|uniref:Uncharacterized protein n=1 Tax=Aspergillus mulundensis TaxID=1810919 RepID=A0A3D8S5E9_9EURO|nr:hypothetical protein DSM5745_04977 [Aspergillus mulundensis]RDW81420.1 hypothetical protein DSM5745_04977 [Aspergillus mulundensis]
MAFISRYCAAADMQRMLPVEKLSAASACRCPHTIAPARGTGQTVVVYPQEPARRRPRPWPRSSLTSIPLREPRK